MKAAPHKSNISDALRAQIFLMNAPERLAFSQRTGLNKYAVGHKYSQALQRYYDGVDAPLDGYGALEKRLLKQGYFDFSVPADIRAVHGVYMLVLNAKKLIWGKYQFSLRAPNLLYRPKDLLFRPLSYYEQLGLLLDTAAAVNIFLTEPEAPNRWKYIGEDPADTQWRKDFNIELGDEWMKDFKPVGAPPEGVFDLD